MGNYYEATKSEYLDAVERICRWIMVEGEKPKYVEIAGKRFFPSEYEDAIRRVQKWIDNPKNLGKLPNTVRFGVKPTSTWDGIYREQAHSTSKQPDAYSCGSNTAVNVLSTFGIKSSDKEMRAYCGTGMHGTNPEDLIRGVLRKMKESGFKNSRCDSYNTVDFGGETKAIETIGKYMADPGHAVAVLVNTGGAGWKKFYSGTFEHWVMPIEINTKNKTVKVNDPARSYLLSFSYNEFMTGVRIVPRKSWYVFVAKK